MLDDLTGQEDSGDKSLHINIQKYIHKDIHYSIIYDKKRSNKGNIPKMVTDESCHF
jgi:hypothetical protein